MEGGRLVWRGWALEGARERGRIATVIGGGTRNPQKGPIFREG